ncbi:MAG TPA: glycogen/starch synthase [Candidatus Limnocylindria bacterium]|nr:glycogen/starch synthase [Candidatus Limnocylindria bacterium]
MQIVFAAAEAAPYAKVGGLADVAGSLPQALAALGHDVTLYLPLHRTIDRAKFQITDRAPSRSVPYGKAKLKVLYPSVVRDGVRVVFVRNDQRLGRDRVYGEPDDAKRYALFCRAVLEDIRDSPPDVVHAHDWHAALLVPLVARTRALAATSTVFTIHNLAYQGRTDKNVLALIGLPRARLPVEGPSEANPMARAIVTADVVSTVSERYAKEILTNEFGEGLQALLRERRRRLFGIVNGIDTTAFDPATDRHIAARYSADDPSGKAVCKAALQNEGGLGAEPRAPIFGVVGRLVEQKGIDLLTAAAPKLLDAGGQLVVLGTGDPAYEAKWKALASRYAGKLWLTLGFDAALAQRIYAGSDLFLMPSRFEPCGLGQLISFRYGTIPVVHEVGGLAETVRDIDRDGTRRNGFSFAGYSPAAFDDAIARAMRTYRGSTEEWTDLVRRVMREDHSWAASAKRYVELYKTASRVRKAA